ncbi:Hypothetical predicted protein [Olea europaea subsp. europaea]|uniref:Uncharacterized protein n=1 Tax=Olea europaea subsp. europaea TaxID=158383 RepID=A0A8S0QBH7_OLEEU|nr:Hypothetical predicted protein [Olea europaea subsp. europaea]
MGRGGTGLGIKKQLRYRTATAIASRQASAAASKEEELEKRSRGQQGLTDLDFNLKKRSRRPAGRSPAEERLNEEGEGDLLTMISI